MPGTKTGPICWRNSRGDPEDWRVSVRRGGYPTPAVHLGTTEERTIWFDGYASTYLERDLRSLSSITALPDFRRLMRATALRIGQPVNQTELGRDVSLPQPTVRRYLNLLEISYLLVRLPAYSVSRTKRLIKSPKIYWGDAGLALHLAGQNEPGGAHLENLVLHDLLAWRDSRLNRAEILYWRTTVGEEVDFVVETDGSLLPIEVKATSRPRLGDARHLRTFRAEYGDMVRTGDCCFIPASRWNGSRLACLRSRGGDSCADCPSHGVSAAVPRLSTRVRRAFPRVSRRFQNPALGRCRKHAAVADPTAGRHKGSSTVVPAARVRGSSARRSLPAAPRFPG